MSTLTNPPANGDSLTLADIIRARRTALTPDELAEFLSITKRRVCEMAKAGRIPSMLRGSMLRFDPKLTAEWLQEQTKNQASP